MQNTSSSSLLRDSYMCIRKALFIEILSLTTYYSIIKDSSSFVILEYLE